MTACIVSVKTNWKLLLLFEKPANTLFEKNVVENGEVSRLLIQSSSENSLLNERSKNKYPFKRNRIKELTPFNALELILIQ